MAEPVMGDIREGAGVIEAFDGRRWFTYRPIPDGIAYREAAIRLCAPLWVSESELQARLDRP